jgi:hypothetical protein
MWAVEHMGLGDGWSGGEAAKIVTVVGGAPKASDEFLTVAEVGCGAEAKSANDPELDRR